MRTYMGARDTGLRTVLKRSVLSRRSAPVRVLVNRLLGGRGLALSATRDYANKDVTTHVASITNDSRCFGKDVMTCTGRMGARLLNMSVRALRGENTMDRRAIVRVMGNTVGTLGASYTMTASKVTNPDKKARRGPINAI